MLDRIADENYKKDRARATSRFLRGAFEVSTGVPERISTPRIQQRNCRDAGGGIVRALTGKKNSQFISKEISQ